MSIRLLITRQEDVMALVTDQDPRSSREVDESGLELMSIEQLLELLPGVSRGLLAQWRYEGHGPDFVKLGRRPLYVRKSVQEWLEANLHVQPHGV
ncbi:AlpA family transcriptional regulator [Microbacterium sp. T2.11-28]|nr:hypothetical protein [Microbacterium sp. T2.11-28]